MLIRPELMEEAERVALLSPCIRRKYGVVISTGPETTLAANYRVSKCCNGDICIRDRFRNSHAEGIEKGAEIHAEQAALILWRRPVFDFTAIYLAGFDKNGEKLLGQACRPCHLCAMMLRFAGFSEIIIRQTDNSLEPVSIAQIIEDHEENWGEPYTI